MINTEPWVGGIEEEYETQHFGFGTQRLKIAVRQMVEEKIRTGVKDMESYLRESLDLNETDKATLTHSCNKLIRLYCERASPSLEVIDSEVERIIGIPSTVLLPEDEVQLNQISDEEYENLQQEVTDLRRRVQRGVLMETLLSAEVQEIASIERVCETAKKDMEALDSLQKNIENEHSLKNLLCETDFLCASLPFMTQDVEPFFN